LLGALAVDDVLSVERVVLVKWVVGPNAVSIDSERLLRSGGKQESNRRLVRGFRRILTFSRM